MSRQPLLADQPRYQPVSHQFPGARSELRQSIESRTLRCQNRLIRFTQWLAKHSLEIFHGSTVFAWTSSIILALFHHEDIADEDTRQSIQRAFSVGLTAITGFGMMMHYGLVIRQRVLEPPYQDFINRVEVYIRRYEKLRKIIADLKEENFVHGVTVAEWDETLNKINPHEISVIPKKDIKSTTSSLQDAINRRSSWGLCFFFLIMFTTICQLIFQSIDLFDEKNTNNMDLYADVTVSGLNALIGTLAICYYWFLYKHKTLNKADKLLQEIHDKQKELNALNETVQESMYEQLIVQQRSVNEMRKSARHTKDPAYQKIQMVKHVQVLKKMYLTKARQSQRMRIKSQCIKKRGHYLIRETIFSGIKIASHKKELALHSLKSTKRINKKNR